MDSVAAAAPMGGFGGASGFHSGKGRGGAAREGGVEAGSAMAHGRVGNEFHAARGYGHFCVSAGG